MLFYNTWTIHTKTYIQTHTHMHTHTGQFEESLWLALLTLTEVDHKQILCYLYCIQINSPVSSNNRDLFGLLAFS